MITLLIKNNIRTLLKLVVVLIIASGCGGYNVRPDISAEERFKLAKSMFQKKDYYDAKNQFKILTLNNPGSAFVDEAQYFLAESHFHEKEYIIAADEYNRLTRLYSKSQWVDDARYKIGLCDFKLSPKPSLDQKYTRQAVAHFQSFIEEFPNSDLVPEAERMLKVCRNKLAEKEYKAGELYRKMSSYHAASVYFNSVLENYYDSKFVTDALYWKAECHYRLNQYDDAREVYIEFTSKYPKSKHLPKVKKRLQEIESNGAKELKANGVSPANNQTKN